MKKDYWKYLLWGPIGSLGALIPSFVAGIFWAFFFGGSVEVFVFAVAIVVILAFIFGYIGGILAHFLGLILFRSQDGGAIGAVIFGFLSPIIASIFVFLVFYAYLYYSFCQVYGDC